MRPILYKIAAILAWVIGAMAIAAGGQVLMGKEMDYYVIGWLPIYNFAMGVITFLVTAIMLWRIHPYARSAAIATLGVHITVMLLLVSLYREVVAPDSLAAMMVRIAVWVIILALLWIGGRKPQTLKRR